MTQLLVSSFSQIVHEDRDAILIEPRLREIDERPVFHFNESAVVEPFQLESIYVQVLDAMGAPLSNVTFSLSDGHGTFFTAPCSLQGRFRIDRAVQGTIGIGLSLQDYPEEPIKSLPKMRFVLASAAS